MAFTWQVANKAPASLAPSFPEISPVVLQLLYNRGLTSRETIDEVLNPDYEHHLHDPFILKDMRTAVERIFAAIDHGEKIVVHGDYDADGVTSSAVMMSTLKKLIETFGQAEHVDDLLSIFIPHREKEGYGLKPSTVETFAEQKINLVVTVDCGTANAAEVELCKQKGIDVVITDHHQETLTRPAAVALVNPHAAGEVYPFKYLSGVGMAFKTAQALLTEARRRAPDENWEGFEKWLLDLVAIGTVADIMPLVGENRTLVTYGLVVLNKTPRLGLKTLIGSLKSNGSNKNGKSAEITTQTISYQIAPRLNAAGRLDHASTAYDLLMTDDPAEAQAMAEQIDKTNSERQQLTDKIVVEIMPSLAAQHSAGQKLLIGMGHGWPPGLVGLVAGKLVRQFGVPAIVVSLFDGRVIGSARSVRQFDLMVPLKKFEHFFANYGGHAPAAGFTLTSPEVFDDFKTTFQAFAQETLTGVELAALLSIDAAVSLNDLTWELYDQQQKFQPFGEGNSQPLYAVTGLTVEGVDHLGKDNKHLRLMVRQGSSAPRKLIGFGLVEQFGEVTVGEVIDVVVELGVNEWNGNRELQFKIVDAHRHD